MRFDFWTNVSTTSRPLAERARLRLDAALDRFRTRLSVVRVRLIDENAKRGGVDKRCQVQVVGRGGIRVLVSGKGADAASLIDTMADRVGARVGRLVDRLRGSRHGDSFAGTG